MEKKIFLLAQEAIKIYQRIDHLENQLCETLYSAYVPPRIETVVLRVNPELRLLTLSAGRKHKVRRGMAFTIYRGEKWIDTVRVWEVGDRTCIAGYGKGRDVSRGDSARTAYWY